MDWVVSLEEDSHNPSQSHTAQEWVSKDSKTLVYEQNVDVGGMKPGVLTLCDLGQVHHQTRMLRRALFPSLVVSWGLEGERIGRRRTLSSGRWYL